jgi:hypothetical protein
LALASFSYSPQPFDRARVLWIDRKEGLVISPGFDEISGDLVGKGTAREKLGIVRLKTDRLVEVNDRLL